MEDNKDKWIEDAFAKASAEARGMSRTGEAAGILASFAVALPAIIASVENIMGAETATRIKELLSSSRDIDILVAVFIAGYKEGEGRRLFSAKKQIEIWKKEKNKK